jgi:pimeloyl-ACP methyl ester carboxylesterase
MHERGRIGAGGCELEYEWIGPRPEAAPTLVFLHDGLGCVATWRDVPAALAAATGCGALVYSRAGYGGSTARPGPWPVRFMHDEAQVTLPQVLAAFGVRDACLVGHSDGGTIALLYAGGGSPPAPRLRGMVLEAPHVFVEPVCLESIAEMARAYRRGDLARRMARNHGGNADVCFAAWVEVWLRAEFRAWTIEAALPSVRCPVLVLQGEEDEFGTLAQLRAVEAGCGGATEALVLAGCGHTPHHQRRAAALAAMTRSLERWL